MRIKERFENVGYGEEEKKKYAERINNLKQEKDLKGDDILDILQKNLKRHYSLMTTERNISGINESPFDLVVGDEDGLSLTGFEIKGDTDNYSRLKTQLQHYLFAFNEVYLVLHKKEKPEWLPDFVGVIRVFEDGKVFEEKYGYIWDLLDISTDYEWDTLFRMNGLGISSKQTTNILHILSSVRRNITFNRFFGVQNGYGTKNMSKFFPFTEEEKKVLVGFDVPYHYEQLRKDIIQIEKKLETIKEVAKLGLSDIQVQLKSKNRGGRHSSND